MTDREMLEAAAKAVGMRLVSYNHTTGAMGYHGSGGRWWNPLTDDGDALRLAVKLRIWLNYSGCSDEYPAHIGAHWKPRGLPWSSMRWVNQDYVPEEMFISEYKPNRTHAAYQLSLGLTRGLGPATRRAIVRAAAEIGQGMPQPTPAADLPEDNYYKTQAEAFGYGRAK